MQKKRLIKLIGTLIILFIIFNFIPTGYQVMSPGIAQELSPLITVEKGYKENNRGGFLLTAVQSQRATIWDYIYISTVHPPGVELESISSQLPPGMDMEKYIEIMAELMEESKLKAEAVAFRKAGYDVKVEGEGALVVEVLEKGAAAGKLKKDDVIVNIDGVKVEFATDAVDLIRKHKIGETVKIVVKRGDEELEYSMKTVEVENNPGKASIGVMITTKNLDYEFPREVKFDTRNIVGPSAGGMFTLEIYNQIIKEDLTKGLKIAGTGTISLDGTIGEIDGVEQKIMAAEKAGADIFLVPVANYEDARKAAEKIKLYQIKDIEEAIKTLENL